MSERDCRRCEKPIPQTRNSKAIYCSKRCSRAAHQEANPEKARESREAWRQRNPDQRKAATKRRYWKHRDRLNAELRLRKYGVSQEQYDEMVRRQHGLCAICKHAPTGRPLFVDHDHGTGEVRGLLCSNCNVGLGHFKDDPRRLEAAISYLWRRAIQ